MKIVTGKAGTPHVTSQQFRQFVEGAVGRMSYILTSGENLEPELSSNNLLKIRSGMMCHHGNISCVELGTYDEVTIQNGNQGMKRIDLVANRYSKNDETGLEENNWIVIQGTPAADDPATPAHTEGNLQEGDLVDDCPVFEAHLDGINVTEIVKLLDVSKNMSTLNAYLAELLPKTINASALALLSHWQVMTADVWKEADTVHINMEIYTSAVIQANHMYTINTPASTDPDVRPAKLSFLSAFATDAAYGNTVAVTGMVTREGAIQISIPNASRPYVFITGEYRTAN